MRCETAVKDQGGGMTSYWFEVKQCPNCDCEFIYWAVASCNTFHAKFYTDGFVDGPMYDEGGYLLTCPGCNKSLWCEDVPTKETLSNLEYFSGSVRGSLPPAERVRGSQYEDLLRQAIWKTEAQEKYVRVRAWWSFNSPYRGQITDEFKMPPEQKQNLLRLLQLLDTNAPSDSIMKGEILRELGRFDECLKHLEQPFEDRYLPAVDTIRKLANCENRQVAPIR
jgi:hypothetical protein